MADGPGQCRGGSFVLLISAFRDEARLPSTPAGDQHLAIVPNENNAVLRVKIALILLQFLGSGRKQTAVVPMHLHRGKSAARRKLIVNHGSQGDCFFEHRRRAGMHTLRRAKLQRGKDRREIVNAHVSEPARTEVPPASPTEWDIGGMVRTPRRRPEPKIPIERRGNGWGI